MPRRRDWIYLVNPFDQLTRKNRKLLLEIAEHHMNALEAGDDMVLNALLERTKLPFNHFKAEYGRWHATRSIAKGSTKRTDQLVVELRGSKIQEWNAPILKDFGYESPDYKALFPKGRRPFQQGSVENRIKAVGELAITLEKYPQYKTIQLDALDFFERFNKVRSLQYQKDDQIDGISQEVDTTRKPLVDLLYRNLGVLIDHYNGSGKEVGRYFPVTII